MYALETKEEIYTLSELELIEFILRKVIISKEISNFEIHEISDVWVDDYGVPHYEYSD